ncbi:HAD-IIIC family phosphatase [Acidomonas methanolica]|nr:HAD-IIIC family phosphatase [Acidomonas methanolica]TCS16851.1 HAD superfamily phosphatase (TIGR01681 family)/FkbH-like protein [Acidomonas methanolica]
MSIELHNAEPLRSGVPLDKITWSFGLVGDLPLTSSFVLGRSGMVEGYDNANEATWSISGERLVIRRRDGDIMWVSLEARYDHTGHLTIILKHPLSETTFSLIQNTPAGPVEELNVLVISTKTQNSISDEDYLFPRDLERTPDNIKKVLLIGSCLTALYAEKFREMNSTVLFDYVPYNFASMLPDVPPSPIEDYDFQYVQIPLRTVLGDRVIWASRFNEEGFDDSIYNDACDVLDVMLKTALSYNVKAGLLSFVSNFIVPQVDIVSSLAARGGAADVAAIVRRLNEYLCRRLSDFRNVFLADVDAVAASIGKRYILDDMIYFSSHGAVAYQDWDDFGRIPRNEPIPDLDTFYPTKEMTFMKAVYRQAVTSYRSVRSIDQVKAVIFDLDNTLWRGQLAEHYRPDALPWPHTDGWPMGIWETIQHLRARGILVAISSKNDLDDVRERWDDVVNPKFVSIDDFASVKINWLPKAGNIVQICTDFNIKPKNVVFVDDNPVERASVLAALPDVRVIGGNPYLTRRILLHAAETQIAYMTGESSRREQMVRRQVEREQLRVSVGREVFLASLQTRITFTTIRSTEQTEFVRILELTNKTNQFNTTGKRWTFEQVAAFLNDGGQIMTFRIQDKFAEYGLVGVVYFRKGEIVQYLMSCRVLGMEVEQFVLAEIVRLLRAEGAETIVGTLIETRENTPCREVFLRAGFGEQSQDQTTRIFILNRDDLVAFPTHIQLASNIVECGGRNDN